MDWFKLLYFFKTVSIVCGLTKQVLAAHPMTTKLIKIKSTIFTCSLTFLSVYFNF